MWLTVVVCECQQGQFLQSLCNLIIRPTVLPGPVSNEHQSPDERRNKSELKSFLRFIPTAAPLSLAYRDKHPAKAFGDKVSQRFFDGVCRHLTKIMMQDDFKKKKANRDRQTESQSETACVFRDSSYHPSVRLSGSTHPCPSDSKHTLRESSKTQNPLIHSKQPQQLCALFIENSCSGPINMNNIGLVFRE